MKYLFRARCRNDYMTGGTTTPINDRDALHFKVKAGHPYNATHAT